MEKNSIENLNVSTEYMSGGNSGSENYLNHDNNQHESEDTGNEEYPECDNNLQSNLRRRRGKIISCAKETIENDVFQRYKAENESLPSRLIRRRVPCAGHLMTPRRLWLNKIPTQCDVVIEFPENAPDEALRWLLGRIRSAYPTGLGLQAHVRAHESTKRVAFYITAPINVLFVAAEDARLPKRLKPELGGALKEFTTRESNCFAQITTSIVKDENGDNAPTLFTSQERQWLVLQVLNSLRAGPSDIEALKGKAVVEEGQSIVAAWQETGLITQIFPLHETSSLTNLRSSWVKRFLAPQPLDDIAEYFGVKVALYFAWLGHYTCALGVPAVIGTMLWLGMWGRGQVAQDVGHVIFSLFNVAWASLYLEAWKRYSVELSFRWGTLSTPLELLEPPRPLYKGHLVENPVTGRIEPEELLAWKRRAFRYFVSFPIIGLCLVAVFGVMFLMLRLQDWWDDKIPTTSFWSFSNVIPKVLLAGIITLMDEAYYKLAVWLNDRENYRLHSKYENHLIAKVALFQFVNSFLSLFYIAFYLRDQEKLKEQLAGLLISRQIIGNLRESAWPYLFEQWRLAKLSLKLFGAMSPTQEKLPHPLLSQQSTTSTTKSTDSSTPSEIPSTPKRSIGQAEVESALYKYDGTFSDHLEMLIQMGYVVLFSAAFPLAGLCALANNLLEIRSDAFKLAHIHQRPFGQRVANIGTWQNALSLLGLAAVIVNCALIGLSGQVSRLWPDLTSTQTIILIVTLEHIMLGLRSALTWLLPELPSWLAAEIARAEHCRREMQCKGPSPRPTPPSPPSSTSLSHHENEQHTPDMLGAGELSIASQDTEDIVFEPIGQSIFSNNDDELKLFARRSIDTASSNEVIKQMTPESPLSQTSTVLIRPLHESTPASSGNSLQNIPVDNLPSQPSACNNTNNNNHNNNNNMKNCQSIPQTQMKYAIPPFRGLITNQNSFNNPHASTIGSPKKETRPVTQPIQISEIPPFRKNPNQSQQQSSNTQITQPIAISNPVTNLINRSPPNRASNIHLNQNNNNNMTALPHFKPRKSTEWTPPADLPDHHLTITPIAGAEWAKRLKGESLNLHRSTDCITKELAVSSDSELLKGAPSWTDVALRTEPGTSTSAPSVKTPTDEETKAAEAAAKKSRLKQSLVKRARSVAIFSLKLKERRAREAEKQAANAVEYAKAMQPAKPPGGELSLIPIEQLIQIDDVVKQRNTTTGQPNSTGLA